MKRIMCLAVGGLVVAALCTPSEAGDPSYHVVTLGTAGTYSRATSIGGGQVGGVVNSVPTLWPGFGPETVPLTDGAPGWVFAVDGVHQVGYVGNSATLPMATLWSGSAQSAVNLNPVGYSQSEARSLLGEYQAGFGLAADGQFHALLWHGSADSVVDLNPPGYVSSIIFDMSDDYLVGRGTPATPGATSHALLWNRQTGEVVDLGTGGSWFVEAAAFAISGNQIVGHAADNTSGDSRALVWNDLGASGVEIFLPPNVEGATINDTNGAQQVGTGIYYLGGSVDEAVIWSGTLESMLNLQTFLPRGTESSEAFSIDDQGRVAGYYDFGVMHQAVVWIPDLPDPDAVCVAPGVMAGGLLLRRKRK